MHFKRAALIKTLRNILELSAAYNRIITEQKAAPANLLVYRNQLHFGDKVTRGLRLRHETARPCRRVFHKRSQIRFARLVRIADCVRNSGIRNAAHRIAFHIIAACHQRAVAVTNRFRIGAFVVRRGIAEVNPEK